MTDVASCCSCPIVMPLLDELDEINLSGLNEEETSSSSSESDASSSSSEAEDEHKDAT